MLQFVTKVPLHDFRTNALDWDTGRQSISFILAPTLSVIFSKSIFQSQLFTCKMGIVMIAPLLISSIHLSHMRTAF